VVATHLVPFFNANMYCRDLMFFPFFYTLTFPLFHSLSIALSVRNAMSLPRTVSLSDSHFHREWPFLPFLSSMLALALPLSLKKGWRNIKQSQHQSFSAAWRKIHENPTLNMFKIIQPPKVTFCAESFVTFLYIALFTILIVSIKAP